MPWVQAVPLSDLPVWKIKLQNDGGAIVLRGMQPAARTRLRSHTCSLRGVFSDAHVVRKNESRLFAPCAALGQPLAALPLLRMPHPPCGEKSATLISRPRGAGIWGAGWEACLLRMSSFVNLCCFAPKGRGVKGGRTGGFLHRMSRCCFDNFNSSRLRARNVGERYLF